MRDRCDVLLNEERPASYSKREAVHNDKPPSNEAFKAEKIEYRFEFRGQSVSDGKTFPVGSKFTQTWTLFNDGLTTWPEDTRIAFTEGDHEMLDQNDDPSTFEKLIGQVEPG